ncbi:hypothetical protein [Sphingomonas solaris]|uniref:Nuclease n=1 Tax=Alterirhizorhabdus solaris TaxID=2529389 RepID=A0A558QWE3_9SPHN|nr:hypothetical protein [Sphingomonas solaris]TVV71377.1 hypothetical protein FOY91_16920 [Sphingomonas solaris]
MIVPLPFICLAIALHDVDGPIHCRSGEKVRLQGIGALEMNGRARPGQPSIAGDPRAQRRRMASTMGARVLREDRGMNGQLWFVRPVSLTCTPTGRSHGRITAWCSRADGRDLSCAAIQAGVAVRWDRYDPKRRLTDC